MTCATVNGGVNVVGSNETSSPITIAHAIKLGAKCVVLEELKEKKNAKSVCQGPPNLPQADDMCDCHW